jgi:4-hydroxy-4-methyl-2-oxoglutarate aldolase
MKHLLLILSLAASLTAPLSARAQTISRDHLLFLTAEWKGDRFPDGRPKVPDSILTRMKNVSMEEAWEVLQTHGYKNQFEGGWQMVHNDVPIVGRAVTAHYMPARPDLAARITERGHKEGRIGPMNSWPIDTLQKGDVYVADSFGKITDGTLIGDNLGNSIFAKSGNGVIFDGSVRDLEGLGEIKGFNAFVRGFDPTLIKDLMLMGLNTPIRIGRVTVLPGDVVLAKREGVTFVPAHLADEVVRESERIALRDQFGHQRLREGKYTPGQIDVVWTAEIEADFRKWLAENRDKVDAPRETIDELLKPPAGRAK